MGGAKAQQYIQDGLVFWLDGINKGATDGTWVDLIGNKVYTANNDKYIFPVSNGFRFDYFGDYDYGDTNFISKMTCSSGIVGTKDWTVEAACVANKPSGATMDSSCLFQASLRACCITLNGYYRYDNGNYAWVTNNTRQGSIILSLDDTTGMENGVELTEKQSTTRLTVSGSTVGGSSQWYHDFFGVIHSIRMYNRSLSLEEKLHNQRIDNERFNLGLTL